jgi:hypothetical protein
MLEARSRRRETGGPKQRRSVDQSVNFHSRFHTLRALALIHLAWRVSLHANFTDKDRRCAESAVAERGGERLAWPMKRWE